MTRHRFRIRGLISEIPRGIPISLMPFDSQVVSRARDWVVVFRNSGNTPDGTGVPDYIHEVDLAAGHAAALDHLSPGLKIYNLGTGRGSSVVDAIRTFAKVCGKPAPYRQDLLRVGDVASSPADISKAERLLGWWARRTLENACRDALRWQSDNPSGHLGG